jgi:hypothetical protein
MFLLFVTPKVNKIHLFTAFGAVINISLGYKSSREWTLSSLKQ